MDRRLVTWTDTKNFHQVRAYAIKHADRFPLPIAYRAKVKLHGTNAGVLIYPNGDVRYVSRNAFLTPEKDNQGFATWADTLRAQWSALAIPTDIICIFGEWCGKGIQKGVAISTIDRRVFAVFAARFAKVEAVNDLDNGGTVVTDPDTLRQMVPAHEDLFVVPWHDLEMMIDVDWLAPDLAQTTNFICSRVDAVEKCDPWVLHTFGRTGIGEGLVFFPGVGSAPVADYARFKEYFFKAKGDAHKTFEKARPAQSSAEMVASLYAFAQSACTPARLEQGARAISDGKLEFSLQKTGAFLAWMAGDIAKECQLEIEASGLDPKKAIGECSKVARAWWLKECK